MILDMERHCWRLDDEPDAPPYEPAAALGSATDWGWACLALIVIGLAGALGWHVLIGGWPQ